MRKFDFVLLGLIVLVGFWCLGLQLGFLHKAENPKSETSIESSGSKENIENRLEQLERSVKTFQDEQRTISQKVESLHEAIDSGKDAKSSSRSRQEVRADTEGGGVIRTEKELEKFVDSRIARYLQNREKEAMDEAKGLIEEISKHQEEMLDEWVKGAVKALNLTERDEEIIRNLVVERNEKIEEKLEQEKKPMLPFGDKLMREADEEMFKGFARTYGDAICESFKRYYKENPLPFMFSSGKGGAVRIGVFRPEPPQGEEKENKPPTEK
jgi:uncharacterized protein YukE